MAVWKDVPGYEGLYLVSDDGQVMSVDRDVFGRNASGELIVHRKGKIIKPHLRGRNGLMYVAVGLSRDGETVAHSVHKLVAEAFIPNPEKLPEINHKDKNTQNNVVSNLEWCDRQYNVDYSKARKVAQYFDGEKVAVYKSISYAGAMTGIGRTAISNALNGLSRTAGGYEWRFESEEE